MIKTLLGLTLLTTPLTTPLTAPPPQPPPRWSPCPIAAAPELQCADLPVPLAAGGDRKITLKVARLPATGARKGSVLVNFGGPQGHQIASLASRTRIFDRIRTSLDVVTWDPRGYPGLSDAVLRCDWGFVRTPPFPDGQAALDRLAAGNRARADRCRATDPELFDHMDSASDARDADAIRAALGDERMNFLGLSYGGTIAQSYARLFPHRVRTMYIDGTRNHSLRDWERELDAVARETERFMDRFFAWAPAGTGKRWRALIAAADREPIPAPAAGARFDGTQLRAIAFLKLRPGPAAWGEFLAAISAAEAGDASAFAVSARQPYPGAPGGGYKECLDFPRPHDQRRLARTTRRLRAIAPNTGASFALAWHLPLTCAGWPVPVTNPPAPMPRTLPPLLGAGTWQDYESTRRVAEQIPGSRTIRHDGPGHNLFGAMANPCVIAHVSAYVTERRLPPRGTTCP
ncbi:alpha/beta fold hydrolase [Bailinhaonella thermotolerans]|uniref:Alpha/beta fold hydrolase n=1 Tax=Bailinhaonella thermotolerans TaxID=1070861 RepID=A0A3A4AKX0_9ACTN|nr:alpha/beta fold hydrolase [Bailinhaonella thermotolerans]RJL27157.1 alpha/beta fold hydrolase [Bailinhaonella thermotolerans]